MSISKIWIWNKVPGITGRYNDIIYANPMSLPTRNILVYFGGDVQDIQENMEKHADSKKYTEWSLQNTATILSTNFPKHHIFVIHPSRMHMTRNAVYSCFDNFVPGNEYGVPSFRPLHNSLLHLQELMKSSLEHVKMCSTDKNIPSSIEGTALTLMGFSKGCVVLNQLLHEFHYYQNRSEPDIAVDKFIKSIESIWWLDGGHGGSKNTWITDSSILKSFSELRIHAYVHVTPYQVKDSHRPWICSEENSFCNTLQSFGVPMKRTLHFADEPRSLKLHFNVLKTIGSQTG